MSILRLVRSTVPRCGGSDMISLCHCNASLTRHKDPDRDHRKRARKNLSLTKELWGGQSSLLQREQGRAGLDWNGSAEEGPW